MFLLIFLPQPHLKTAATQAMWPLHTASLYTAIFLGEAKLANVHILYLSNGEYFNIRLT